MKNLFGFGSGWRQVTGNANYKHEYMFYYLMISPSYWLAHRQVHLNEVIPQSELPKNFDQVLDVYRKFGDIYSTHFIEWWDQTGKDLFADKNTKDRILISIDPTKPKQELLDDFMELLTKLDSREKKTPSTKIQFEVNKIRVTSLHNRFQLVLAKAEFFQNKIKKEQLWKLAKYIGINSTKTKEIRLNSKKTSANLETRTYLSILASKNLSDALCIAENAARGKFPSLEPIKIGLKFDYVTIKKQQDQYAKRTWALLVAEEKNKKDYGKILSPSNASRKIKAIDEREMVEKHRPDSGHTTQGVSMSQKLFWTAEQIQKELQTQVNEIREIEEDNAYVKISLPYIHAEDNSGTNWDINVIPNADGYIPQILAVIAELRGKVNLKNS